MNFGQRIDFATLMEPVALALLGEPNSMLSKPPRDVRYGSHGSLSVDFESGQFYDHEHNVGGGVLDLIGHKTGCDHSGAMLWLRTQGLLINELPASAQVNGKDRTGEPKKIIAAEFSYSDASGTLMFVVERIEYQDANGAKVLARDGKAKKSYRQKRPDPYRPGHWLWNMDGVPALPFRLPELTEAIAVNHPLMVVEGEAKADLLWSWNVAATCCAGGAKKWKAEHSTFLKDGDIVLIPDCDGAGWEHINIVGASLVGIARRIRVLVLPDLGPKGDIVDWAKAGGTREQFDALLEKAPPWVPLNQRNEEEEKRKAAEREDELLDNLAKMPEGIASARERNRLAKELHVSPSDIKAEIKARQLDQIAPLHGSWVVEPHPDPVEGDDLIRDLIKKLRKHVVCTKEEALTITLWIMLAWVHDDAAIHSPILVVTSAEPESGKTTTLSLIALLAPRAISSVEISKAALYRAIAVWSPSFVIDEFDTVLASTIGDQAELRAVINSGHTRGQGVVRCITDEHKPELFSTFCPKALGMVGRKLPPATLSRCIFVELRRRKPDESIDKFKHEDDSELRNLRSRLRRWAMDSADVLRDAVPSMPDKFDNRRADNHRLQFAIADLCSKAKAVDTEWNEAEATDWGDRARATAAKIEASTDSRTAKVKLVTAIKAIFESVGDDAIGSADLINKLTADDGSEWREFKNGKPLTQVALAKMLKDHKIFPDQVRPKSLGGDQVRGYRRSDFEDVWARYL